MPDLPPIPDCAEALKAMVLAQQQQLDERTRLVAQLEQQLRDSALLAEKLKFELARYQRWKFGKKNESLGADQLALWEAALEADIEAVQAKLQAVSDALGEKKKAPDKAQPKRQPLPAHLPRLSETIEPDTTVCQCGQAMVRIGEDVSETLQMIPSRFWVKRRIRGKWACRCCQKVAMGSLAPAPIDKAIGGTSVLANVIVAKYADHQPLHRQELIYARMGVPIPRSTMAGWVGRLGVLIEPLTDLMAQRVCAINALQADETPVPVLQAGTGKTATGYLWAYRTLPADPVQAVVFDFAMSRAQQHPNRMLAGFEGTLQVDGYAGYNDILRRPGVIEAGCWAHARRKFVEVYDSTQSPVAQQALMQIAALYEIESDLREANIIERERQRQARAAPLLAQLHRWLLASQARTLPRSALAKAMQYTLNRWKALVRYVDDGRLPPDTNAVENCIRPVALGRRNWMFAGSELGGQRAAQMYSLLGTCKLNGIEPLAYLTDIFERLPSARARDLEAMLPWNWQAPATIDPAAALAADPPALILS